MFFNSVKLQYITDSGHVRSKVTGQAAGSESRVQTGRPQAAANAQNIIEKMHAAPSRARKKNNKCAISHYIYFYH